MLSKFLVLSAAFAGLISAQSIPSCATPCLSSIPSNCNGNPKCICTSQSFISSITCCVIDHCPNPADVEATRNYALQICKPAGVTNLPSGNPQSCSATGSGSGSGSASSTPAPASSDSASSSSASTTPSSNPGGPMSSAMSSSATSGSGSSAAAASSTSASASASGSSSTNLATETGGAAESATTAGNAPSSTGSTGAAAAPSVFLQGFGLVGLAAAAVAAL